MSQTGSCDLRSPFIHDVPDWCSPSTKACGSGKVKSRGQGLSRAGIWINTSVICLNSVCIQRTLVCGSCFLCTCTEIWIIDLERIEKTDFHWALNNNCGFSQNSRVTFCFQPVEQLHFLVYNESRFSDCKFLKVRWTTFTHESNLNQTMYMMRKRVLENVQEFIWTVSKYLSASPEKQDGK